MSAVKIVVFDLGNVLINWSPIEAFRAHFGVEDAAAAAFLETHRFYDWNYARDGGLDEAEALAGLSPEARAVFALYVPNFAATIAEPVAGTWELAHRLHARGVEMHAITNWAASTFPEALRLYPALTKVFGQIIVSGEEKLLKPEPAIYHRLAEQAGISLSDCLFIDDSIANVEGAARVGMQAHHFTDAVALEAELTARGLL